MGNQKSIIESIEFGGTLNNDDGTTCSVHLIQQPLKIYVVDNTFHIKTRNRKIYNLSGQLDVVELKNGDLYDKLSKKTVPPGKFCGTGRRWSMTRKLVLITFGGMLVYKLYKWNQN
jgi:hypothetical protein